MRERGEYFDSGTSRQNTPASRTAGNVGISDVQLPTTFHAYSYSGNSRSGYGKFGGIICGKTAFYMEISFSLGEKATNINCTLR
jgi:hypothetical protein